MKDRTTEDGASPSVIVSVGPPPSDRVTVSPDSAALSLIASIRSGPVTL